VFAAATVKQMGTLMVSATTSTLVWLQAKSLTVPAFALDRA
jgi:hypothetical protein